MCGADYPPHLAASSVFGIDAMLRSDHYTASNPIANIDHTRDGRFWEPLMGLVGRTELADDPTFVDAATRHVNRAECVAELDPIFAPRNTEE